MDAPLDLPWNPIHPNCEVLSDETITTGRAALAKCRELIAGISKPSKPQANVRMANAEIELAGGGSAVEYKAHLRQLKMEQAA